MADDAVAAGAFVLLGIEPSFRVTRATVEAAYLARIAGAHPDMGGAGADPAALNDARRALLDNETRANLVLAAVGGPGAGDDRSLPDGFLQEMMATRMEIEESIEADGDAGRAQWSAWAEERRETEVAAIGALFDVARDDPGGGSGVRFSEIRRRLNAWRYTERLLEQLDPGYDPQRADFS